MRLATVALIVVGISIPVCAQRSGSHGGFSGHSAWASHGSFRAYSSRPYAGSFHSYGGRSLNAARGSERAGAGNFRARRPYSGDRHSRRPYISVYGTTVPYIYPGWNDGYPYGYSDDNFDTGDSDDSDASANGGPNENVAQPPEAYQPPLVPWQPALPPWQPNSALQNPPSAPSSEDAVTLIFKDGRPPEKIHNYVLTQSTLYVNDSHRRMIPTSQLDLVATEKVNREDGVDFQLPETP